MTKLWKWGKRLLWVLAGLFILLGISVSILVYLINSEAFLEKQIQQQLGMSSQVGELDVSLFSGTVTISATRIGPEDNPAISFDKLTAEVSYSGLFSNLLIESVQLDKAVIRYPFEYQLPESNQAEAEHHDEPFFFEQLSVSEIRINDSDFIFDDEVALKATGINLVISDLPVAKRSIFLFGRLKEFFVESNTTIVADIEQLTTDKSTLNRLNLQANVSEGDVIIEKFSSSSADINIDLTEAPVSSGPTASNANANGKGITLPFNDLLIESIDIGTTNFKLQGQHELSVTDLRLEFTKLILVKNQTALWDDWQDFYGQQNSQYRLSSKALVSQLISYDLLTMEGNLSSNAFYINQLAIEKPVVNYEADAQAENKREDTQEQGDQFHFPFSELHLSKLNIKDGSLALSLVEDQLYSAQSINSEVSELPVIAEHQLVIARPAVWQNKVYLSLQASDIELPQVSIEQLSTDIETEAANVLVQPIRADGVKLKLDQSEASAAENNAKLAESELPINQVLLKDIEINQFNLDAVMADDELTVDNMKIKLDAFAVIQDRKLFEVADLNSINTSFDVSADSLQTNQLSVRSLSANGSLADSRLVLESLVNQSGRLSLDLSEPADPDVSSQSSDDHKPLPLKSIVVNSLNLRNFNGDIIRLISRTDLDGKEITAKENLRIQDLDFTASRLWLVKNNQLISDWYDTEFENAFKSAELKVAQVQQDEDVYSNIHIKAVQSDRKVAVNPLTVRVNETELTADWLIDLTKPGYSSHFDFDFQNLALEKLVKPDNENSIALRGKIDGLADLTFTGLTADTILKSLNGQILLTNKEPIQLVNLNINKVLERFLESQEFGLLDIGGFVLAGPAGLLLSQGVSIQGVLSNLGANKGNTMFGQINVDMTIEKGVLKTRDVAASTQLYRFAFDGNIDLSLMAFNNFEFMILNKDGCKEYSQTLNGSLTSPEIQTFRTAFDAVTGSVVGLLKSGVGLLTGGYCQGVYDGKVTHPEKGVEIPHPELKQEEPEVEDTIEVKSEEPGQ